MENVFILGVPILKHNTVVCVRESDSRVNQHYLHLLSIRSLIYSDFTIALIIKKMRCYSV